MTISLLLGNSFILNIQRQISYNFKVDRKKKSKQPRKRAAAVGRRPRSRPTTSYEAYNPPSQALQTYRHSITPLVLAKQLDFDSLYAVRHFDCILSQNDDLRKEGSQIPNIIVHRGRHFVHASVTF
jgi:hypothetical protein